MKAVIMAGGEGTRLRPLTCGLPKPMVPIIGRPVMEHIINHLKGYEIKDIAVTMAYLPSVIMDYFGDGSAWDVNLNYYTEEVPLGTGGSVKNAEDFLDDTFIIISGDALTDIDIAEAISFHKAKKSMATLVLKKVETPLEYGVIITDGSGRIIRFLEKPSWGEVFSDTINTGIYVLEPEVLAYYKKGENFDFSKDLFPKLLRDGVPMYGYVSEAYWNDIGDLKVYKEVNLDILYGKVKVRNSYRQLREGIWVGRDCSIDSSCVLKAPVLIGDNCVIGANAHIAESVISDCCQIDSNASIKRSIVWKNSTIRSNVQSRGAVLCEGTMIKKAADIFEDAVIGSRSIVSEHSIVKPDVKIWPEKLIEEGVIVNQSLIWGTKIRKTLFGYKDISGDINTEITPEFSSRLASAFGSTFKEGAKVIISTDSSNGSIAVKDAFCAGLLTTGIQIMDLGCTAMPINRYAVKFYKADGGAHIRIDCQQEDSNKVHIELVDKTGSSIDRTLERKIENVFVREDFKRCNFNKIRAIQHIERFTEFYLQSCTNSLKNLDKIKAKKPKVLLQSRSKHTVLLASAFLENIGCTTVMDYSQIYSLQNASTNDNYINYIVSNVLQNKADIGILLSEDGENAVLIDNYGRVIERNKYIALSSLIIMNTSEEKRLIIPYNTTSAIETMAGSLNYQVIRTKNAPSELMKEIFKDQESTIPLQYVLSFDAIWGIGAIIDYLVSNEISLGEAVAMLPEFYMEKREVECDWRHKGRLIREFIEENKDNQIELFEGIKINQDKGWALILPDSEKPVCNVFTEGYSEEYAKDLCDFYSDRINEIVKHFD